MQRQTLIIVVIALGMMSAAVYLALAGRTTSYPDEAARQFWEAVGGRDKERLRTLVRARDRDRDDLIETLLPVAEVTLGRTVIDGGRAEVDTRVTVVMEGDPAVDLKTVLVREERFWLISWKVDYDASTALVARGANFAKLMDSVRELGDQIAGQVEQAMDGIREAIPGVQGEMERLEQQLRSEIPRWKERLEEFTRELEEVFKQPPAVTPESEPEPEPEPAVEI